MLLAKIMAVVIVVWFFHSAKEHEQAPFKWIIIGLIGFGIVWEAAHLLVDMLTDNRVIAATLPAVVAGSGAGFIRYRLVSEAKKLSQNAN